MFVATVERNFPKSDRRLFDPRFDSDVSYSLHDLSLSLSVSGIVLSDNSMPPMSSLNKNNAGESNNPAVLVGPSLTNWTSCQAYHARGP